MNSMQKEINIVHFREFLYLITTKLISRPFYVDFLKKQKKKRNIANNFKKELKNVKYYSLSGIWSNFSYVQTEQNS